jgi:phage terminase small subunit
MKKKLSKQQELFTKEYLVDLNATQSAIRAGYSKKTARSQGQRLLTNVDIQELIQKEMDMRSERIEITADEVLEEIENLHSETLKTYMTKMES